MSVKREYTTMQHRKVQRLFFGNIITLNADAVG
jgi:hypothetical protein